MTPVTNEDGTDAKSNPFFLLSAGCMLAGCYLWSGADSEAPARS